MVSPTVARTGADGIATVSVEFGRAAGEAKLVASVDAPLARDTLAFTVLPGRAASVQMVFRDTSLMVGDSMRSPTRIYDAYGNRRHDAGGLIVTRGVGFADFILRGDSLVTTGREPGRFILKFNSETATDSLAITVFPAGDAASWLDGDGQVLQATRLDGSHARTLAIVTAKAPGTSCVRWLSSGDRVLYTPAINGGGSYYATVTGETGRILTGVPSGGSIFPPTYPEPSADGQWVYFAWHSGYPDYSSERSIWRSRWDGSGLQEIVPPVKTVSTIYDSFSLSNDGTRLVVQTSPYAQTGSLQVWETETRRGTDLRIGGVDPKWGPRDSLISYLGPDRAGVTGLQLIRPDGTASRTIGTRGTSYIAHSWSPDGRWILATSNASTGMRDWLIDVDSGEPLPLAGVRFQYNWSCRSWRPTSGR